MEKFESSYISRRLIFNSTQWWIRGYETDGFDKIRRWMMKIKNIILVTILFSALFVNCNEAKEDKSAIEGKIVALLPPCQGNGILISVENIQNFGESGSFIYSFDSLVYYQNSIVVPYFDKSIEGGNKIPSLLSDGDELIFECRIKTDADDSLFYSNIVCNMDLIPPSAPRYIITKIISYQKK